MTPQTEESFRADQLRVSVYQSSRQMALAAAAAVTAEVRRLIAERGRAVGLFASGPNREAQSEFLDCLVETAGIEWTRVIGFQLEEYVGLDEDAPQSFRRLLLDRLVRRVPMAEFHAIRGEAANPAAVCENYAALLRTRPPDFAVLGIGEDGRLGAVGLPLNDSSNLNSVRVVELDDACRQRQVRDGVFASLETVPRRAISFPLPVVLAYPRL
ncbi:MAG: 6-phosphogluconolactonase, partial [Blastocatellia bacterium]